MDFSEQSCIIGEAWDVRFDEKSISSKTYECMLTKKNLWDDVSDVIMLISH